MFQAIVSLIWITVCALLYYNAPSFQVKSYHISNYFRKIQFLLRVILGRPILRLPLAIGTACNLCSVRAHFPALLTDRTAFCGRANLLSVLRCLQHSDPFGLHSWHVPACAPCKSKCVLYYALCWRKICEHGKYTIILFLHYWNHKNYIRYTIPFSLINLWWTYGYGIGRIIKLQTFSPT